jgi:hypothetical protein
LIIIPQEYQDLELSKPEKVFISLIKNKLDSNSYMVLKVNPVGENSVNVLILPRGVCFLETVLFEDISIVKSMISLLMMMKQKVEEKLYNKLLIHRYFNIKSNENIFLKFPFSYKFYLPAISKDVLLNVLTSPNEREFAEKYCLFSEYKTMISSSIEDFVDLLLANPSYPYSADWQSFDNESINILIHLIAPEYTIPRITEYKYDTVVEGKTTSKFSNQDYAIKPGDLTVDVLRLDDDQINIINNIKKGHQLILACAGSGKSVLLISKCFKVASLHPDKQFLITCKNRNLSNLYDWRINVAGFRNRNVKCCTFDKLCQDLLAEVGIPFQMSDFEGTFQKAREALIKGKITRRFYGIFIDEIQIFKSEWYEFCYNLLESHVPENYFFTICGDKSQDIVANIKQGNAPWQGNPNLPKYTGRSIRIEKNYRNTVQINSFVDRFTQNAKVYFRKLGIDMEMNEDLFLRGKAFRNGPKPEVILTDRFNEAQEVINKVLYLKEEKNIPLSEIAVLFYYRHYVPESYYIYKWLKDKLNIYYLEYSELISTDESYGVLYGDRRGLSLCTIESSLGLDFQAIIICGLKPLGAYYKTKNISTFSGNTQELEQYKEDFYKNINTLYTACTRARDYLYIVLTEDRNESVYSRLLLDSIDE